MLMKVTLFYVIEKNDIINGLLSNDLLSWWLKYKQYKILLFCNRSMESLSFVSTKKNQPDWKAA